MGVVAAAPAKTKRPTAKKSKPAAEAPAKKSKPSAPEPAATPLDVSPAEEDIRTMREMMADLQEQLAAATSELAAQKALQESRSAPTPVVEPGSAATEQASPSSAPTPEVEPGSAAKKHGANISAENIGETKSQNPIDLPSGIKKHKFKDAKERRAFWAKYIRSLTPNTSRECKIDKCPGNIQMKMLGAHERSYYFQLWCQHEEKWCRVKVWEEHYKLEMKADKTKVQWLTRGQLMKLYEDEEVVEALVQAKLKLMGHFRPHPELPLVQNAMQYKCVVEDSQTMAVQQIVRQGMSLECEAEGETGRMLAQQHQNQSMAAFRDTSNTGMSAFPGAAQQLTNGGSAGTDGSRPQEEAGAMQQTAEDPAAAAAAAVSDPKLAAALRRIQDDEQREVQRVRKQQERKTERDAFKETPSFKTKSWLNAVSTDLQDLEEESKKLKDEDGKCICEDVPIPMNLANEFLASFGTQRQTLSDLKRTLGSLHKSLSTGDPKNCTSASAETLNILCNARKSHDDWKTLVRSFKALWKRYFPIRSLRNP